MYEKVTEFVISGSFVFVWLNFHGCFYSLLMGEVVWNVSLLLLLPSIFFSGAIIIVLTIAHDDDYYYSYNFFMQQ